MSSHQKNNKTIPKLFLETVKKHPNKTCFIMVDGREWTFQQVDEYTNQIANFLYDKGFRRGDVIALFMENRPEYACFWLAMAKIGVLGALINFNLRMESLAHCIKISEAKALLFGSEVAEGENSLLLEIFKMTFTILFKLMI